MSRNNRHLQNCRQPPIPLPMIMFQCGAGEFGYSSDPPVTGVVPEASEHGTSLFYGEIWSAGHAWTNTNQRGAYKHLTHVDGQFSRGSVSKSVTLRFSHTVAESVYLRAEQHEKKHWTQRRKSSYEECAQPKYVHTRCIVAARWLGLASPCRNPLVRLRVAILDKH